LREPDHFDFLRERVLPQLAGRECIDIWSAACSTGEEIWTLACVINDALPNRRARILATDISNKALRIAAQAAYPVERCEAIPASWLSRYFVADGRPPRVYRVAPAIRAQATFRRLNLTEPITWPQRFPIVFCRNVMIYFDRATQERVVRQLSNWLEPGGHLFVGHAESLTRISHDLEYVRPAIYRKPDGKGSKWIRSS